MSASAWTGTSPSKPRFMTTSAFYILAAMILIAPHASENIAKAGTLLMIVLALIAFALENHR